MKKNYQSTRVKWSGQLLKSFSSLLVGMALCLPFSQFGQQTYTFTPCAASGSVGPTQAQVNAAYLATNLNGSVTVIGSGIQSWTVPASGLYSIDASGASGGNTNNYPKVGGLGARMIGQFNLTAGGVIRILVGQAGANGCGTAGGGGGSFVTYNGTIILAAGGGGGASSDNNAVNGTTLTSGTQDNPPVSAGGTAGGGGATCMTSVNNGGGGGGYTGNGATAPGSPSGQGGLSFTNGGLGGGVSSTAYPVGGFGGGGSGTNCTVGGGGGGGYSGGAGGQQVGYCLSTAARCGGGGGGSFNSGTSQVNTMGFQTGSGRVIITSLCNVFMTSVGTNTSGAICAGSSVTLSTNGVSNYNWSTGNTTSSVIVVSPTVTTTYSVSATSSLACTASDQKTIIVYPSTPVLSIANTASANAGICPNSTLILTASGAPNYTWTGGITNGSVFSPTTTSGYTVTGGNACGTSTAAISVSIHPLPSVSAVASTASLCSGNTCTLTGVGNATSYAWFSTPVVPGLANGVGIFPSATTVFTVVATSALSCTNSAQATVTVVTTPALAPVLSPQLICIGGSSTITATGATNYAWTPGAFGNVSSIIVSPTISTTYTLTKSNANCVDVKVFSITVNPLPSVFAISNPTIVCANGTATLSGGGANTYTWTNSNPSFSITGAIVSVSPSVTTVYSVAASNGTCANTNTVLVSTNPNPTITIGATSTVICQNDPTTLTLGGGINYTWSPSTITGTNVVVTPTLSTLYTVTGDNVFNCTSSTSQIIIVNPIPPTNAVTNRTLVCVGASATLTAFGANTYQWSTTANTTVTVVNPLVTTIYSVTGFYTATNCQNTKTISVSVFSPTFNALGSNSVCIGGAITLSASGASTYTWNVNPPSPFPSIVVSPSVPTVYVVSATSFSNGVGCISSQSKSISIYQNPTITATPERTLICKGEITNLLGFGGATYVWSTSQTGSAVPVNPTALTLYTVTGTDANGCVGTATTQLKVSNCVGLSNYKIANTQLEIYPNPNNGEFTIHAPGDIRLNLMNELGQVISVFTLNENNDYKVSVKNIANGIYFIVGQQGDIRVNQKIVVTK